MAAEARTVAVVGWGSGVTVGAVLTHDVASVDAFEIEPAVVEASREFEPENGRPLEDRRVHLILGDARNELKRRGPYDLIISEPSNPWITGVANLFTSDFFALAASRLSDRGILCQWFHLYGMSEAATRSLVSTLRSALPHVLVFDCGRDLLLLASRQPVRFDLARMTSLLAKPAVRDNLEQIPLAILSTCWSTMLLDSSGAEAFSKGAPVNTDDNMLLELGGAAHAVQRSLGRDPRCDGPASATPGAEPLRLREPS